MDLFSGNVCLKGLKKLPKRILVVDTYNTTAEEYKKKIRDATTGIEIDFEEASTHYSLIILCSMTFRFNLKDPLTLADGEIWFTRKEFSRKVLMDALKHYSDCEIRNGV